jgi:hypothetical protein
LTQRRRSDGGKDGIEIKIVDRKMGNIVRDGLPPIGWI